MGPGPESILLTGRVAAVTGAARGIGEAIAVTLARFGADVAVCDRDAEALDATGTAIEDLGRGCLSRVLDVRRSETSAEFVQAAHAELGPIDMLVNNAGGTFHARFLDVNAKGQRALVDENFTQVADLIRHTVPLMPERGGSIVNVTSIEAFRAGPGFAVYSAMKAAVENLTKTLALELAGRRIRVNAVAPDVIPTPGDAALVDDPAALPDRAWAKQPALEGGTVWDAAAATVFLCSDLSRFITGTTVHVDGGNYAAGGWKRHPQTGSYHL
ncbi:MAG: Gluconate 5-dehydrogenase [Acidimicrobiales bacterium]|nr:MAG: SDR family oxidoreductase [Actinomycetota bacterium]MBV6510398.1 Gluconate 5-dehydrogenase [Acidimicrobiales bacterium]RIK02594.1 MAG: short-chain dehydrogenase [Acidobacteriota bacterium]